LDPRFPPLLPVVPAGGFRACSDQGAAGPSFSRACALTISASNWPPWGPDEPGPPAAVVVPVPAAPAAGKACSGAPTAPINATTSRVLTSSRVAATTRASWTSAAARRPRLERACLPWYGRGP